MTETIQSIVIVGGGTAGWLAAAYLNRALNGDGPARCQITLIESAAIGPIGVGEATVPSLRRTMRFLGLSESEWLVRCQATFKLANKYVNWSGLSDQPLFWHPFGEPPTANGVSLIYHWLKRKLAGVILLPLDVSCYPAVAVCQARKAPKPFDAPDYGGPLRYGYHLDAAQLAAYLKEKSLAQGVNHRVDTVEAVILDERGFISHLETAEHGALAADLFIDCTGFRGLLINQTLGEPFISYGDQLLCDRAIALPLTHDEPRPLNPYATATALNAGWAWYAPLLHRSGHGYVYASDFLTPDAAERELRQHLGPQTEGVEAYHLTMRIGRTRRAWVNNCVSLGLAGGFVEPLEATGIGLIEVELEDLVSHFPDKQFAPPLLDRYNRRIEHYYEHIRDFILLIYHSTYREETPFWRANKYQTNLPDSLQAKLDLWERMPPLEDELFSPPTGFGALSYLTVLAGMGRLPQRSLPRLDYWDDTEADAAFAAVQGEGQQLTETLPDHDEYLNWLRFYETLRVTYQEDE